MANSIPPHLLQLMCEYYPDADRARVFINRLSIPRDYLDFSGPPGTMWFKLLTEVRKHVPFETICDEVSRDFPNIGWRNIRPVGPSLALLTESPIPPADWKGRDSAGSLERIIGQQSTLLPISFLESGIEASRSVAKVNIPGVGCASGFLIQNNILLTNNHVIDSKTMAGRAEILFNFQLTREGRDAPITSARLLPDEVFVTSQSDDWTAVRVEGDPNAAWGEVHLATDGAKKDQPVNIIQHPGGQPKQIALYHNLVQYADESCVQYLTDTMGGSSGSPVFNSQWKVVAIHRRGGLLTEPNSASSPQQYIRNEGTPIELVRRRLVQEGIIF